MTVPGITTLHAVVKVMTVKTSSKGPCYLLFIYHFSPLHIQQAGRGKPQRQPQATLNLVGCKCELQEAAFALSKAKTEPPTSDQSSTCVHVRSHTPDPLRMQKG